MKDGKIKFVRINGRVIPIKQRQPGDNKKIKQGAALTAGGVVTGAAAGNIAGTATKVAARAEKTARVFASRAQSSLATLSSGRRAKTLEKAGQIAFKFPTAKSKYF